MGGKSMKKRVSGSRRTVRNSLYRIAMKPRKGFFTGAPRAGSYRSSKPQTHLPARARWDESRLAGFQLFEVRREANLLMCFYPPASAWIGQTQSRCAHLANGEPPASPA